jgi:hypothetical protein
MSGHAHIFHSMNDYQRSSVVPQPQQPVLQHHHHHHHHHHIPQPHEENHQYHQSYSLPMPLYHTSNSSGSSSHFQANNIHGIIDVDIANDIDDSDIDISETDYKTSIASWIPSSNSIPYNSSHVDNQHEPQHRIHYDSSCSVDAVASSTTTPSFDTFDRTVVHCNHVSIVPTVQHRQAYTDSMTMPSMNMNGDPFGYGSEVIIPSDEQLSALANDDSTLQLNDWPASPQSNCAFHQQQDQHIPYHSVSPTNSMTPLEGIQQCHDVSGLQSSAIPINLPSLPPQASSSHLIPVVPPPPTSVPSMVPYQSYESPSNTSSYAPHIYSTQPLSYHYPSFPPFDTTPSISSSSSSSSSPLQGSAPSIPSVAAAAIAAANTVAQLSLAGLPYSVPPPFPLSSSSATPTKPSSTSSRWISSARHQQHSSSSSCATSSTPSISFPSNNAAFITHPLTLYPGDVPAARPRRRKGNLPPTPPTIATTIIKPPSSSPRVENPSPVQIPPTPASPAGTLSCASSDDVALLMRSI